MNDTAITKPLPEVGFNSARKSALIGSKNRELQRQIKDWLWDQHRVSLPPLAKEYREQQREIFNFDRNTGEIDDYNSEAQEELNPMCKFYYALGENRVFLAQFTDGNGFQQLVKPVGQYYSKHRLDPIWNSSKSRKFRYRMAEFLKTEKWYEHYHPTHLVLTVPHKFGKWRGKEIYIHDLIKAFWELRRQKWWKRCIAGGLYCLEVKKNNENGYHIHLHVLCFQEMNITDDLGIRTNMPVNYVRDKVKDSWKKIVDNTTSYDGIHYSSLYFYERDENGKMIPMENCYYMASDGDPDTFTDQFGNVVDPTEINMNQFKKHYVKAGEDVEFWIKGVMECLKYHFKPGVLEKEDGSYNMDLIMQLLENTKGDRFMSKFGKLHNHPGLTLSGKNQTEAEDEADIDAECLGNAAAAELALVNPFTDEIALPEDYVIIMTRPDCIYTAHDARGRPTINVKPSSPVSYFEPGTTVSDAFRMYASKKYNGRPTYNTTTDQLAIRGNPHWPKPSRKSTVSDERRASKLVEQKGDECPF